jgi:integrase
VRRAGYQKRKDRPSKFRVQVRIRGQRLSKSFETLEELLEWKRDKLREKKGSRVVDERASVTFAFKKFLRERKSMVETGELSPGSLSNDSANGKFWVNRWKNDPLSEKSEGDILSGLRDLLTVKKLSVATRNRHRALLHAFFKWAKLNGYHRGMDFDFIEPLEEKPSLQRRPHGVWKEREKIERYLLTAAKRGPMVEALTEWLTVAGNRVGEVTGRKWEDVNLKSGDVEVNSIVDHKTGLIAKRTKGQRNAGKFEMTLPPRVLAALQRWKRVTKFGKDADLIFSSPTGRPIKHFKVYRLHGDIIEEAKLPYITLHGLRHCANHQMKLAGMTADARKEMLGRETLPDEYEHKDLEELRRQVETTRYGEVSNLVPMKKGVA